MSKKAVVLLSGGIDSTTCLALAVDEYGAEDIQALCIHYGQKHKRELQSAEDVARYYGVDIIYADLSHVYKYSSCPLLVHGGKIKHKAYAEQLEELGGSGTVDTYVPFRNGLMLSYATAIALSLGASFVYYGAHADDAAGRAYPDCTPEFYNGMNKAICEGSGGKVTLYAPLLNWNKAAVVKQGIELDAPYHLTWSCYEGQDVACGTCGTCRDRLLAFKTNDMTDPIQYQNRGDKII